MNHAQPSEKPEPRRQRGHTAYLHRGRIGSMVLLVLFAAVAGSLTAWKYAAIQEAAAASANQHEPVELVAVAAAEAYAHQPTTTSIGTVLALRSITLRNEVPGTVAQVHLTPGQIVEPGTLLVAMDVSVEQAELQAHQAQATLAQTQLDRVQRAYQQQAVSETEVDRARAERDVARAEVARLKALINRKTLRAPFRARVGMVDLHPGQYLEAGTLLTTLQGVDETAHVDFSVAQRIAATLNEGDRVTIDTGGGAPSMEAIVVAIDARVDPGTRNAMVRARIEDANRSPRPGASVRVRVPAGTVRDGVSVPVSALRRGPEGDHVYVIASDGDAAPRAERRRVQGGPMLGNVIVINAGLEAGEQVATTGSFKLHDSMRVAIDRAPEELASR